MKRTLLKSNFLKSILVFIGFLRAGIVFGQTVTINNNETINASELNENTSIVINAGGTLTMNVSRTFNNVTSTGIGTSSINGMGQLTTTGVLTVDADNTLLVATIIQANTLATKPANIFSSSATLSGTGFIYVNTITINGIPDWDAKLVINSGLTVEATDINEGTGSPNTKHIVMGNGSLKILGDVNGIESFVCGSNSKIDFAGVNQTIPTGTYFHLDLRGNGIKTLRDYTIVNGDLLVETGTTLTLGRFALTMNSPDARTATINGTLNINGDGRLVKPDPLNKTLVLGPEGVINITDNLGGLGGVEMPAFGTYHLARTSTVHYGSNESQSITDIPAPGYGNLIISGAGNKAPSFSLDIQGDFILQSGNFWPWDMTHTIKGNWIRNGGTFNYDGGRIVFAGSTPQTIGGSVPTTFYNVTFANTNGGITLLQPTSIARNATFTSGVVTSSAINPLIFKDEATSSLLANQATTTSYVNGPVTKVGNNPFVFPIGAGTGFVPLSISAPDNDADAFTAQYFRGAPVDKGDITVVGIDHISGCDYWDLIETADAGAVTTINVTFYWNANNPCSGVSTYVTDPTTIKLVHYSDGSWSAASTGFGSGSPASGSVIFTGLSSFSPFALASTTADANPLPVVFSDVKAFERNNGVQIEWSNLTEKDVVVYTIERSTNGSDFSTIAKQLPNSNRDNKVSYVSFDAVPSANANYYRIKAEETTGKIVYSKILSVRLGISDARLKLYPNPLIGNQVTINLAGIKKGKYELRVVNAVGHVIFKQVIHNQSRSLTQTLNFPAIITPGIYKMMIANDNYRLTKTFLVQ